MKKILQFPLCRKLSFLLIAAFAFMASGCSPMMYDDHPHFSHHRYDPPGHKPKPPKPGHKPKPPKPGHKPKPSKPGHNNQKPPKPGHNNQKPPKPGHNNQKPSKPGHNNHR